MLSPSVRITTYRRVFEAVAWPVPYKMEFASYRPRQTFVPVPPNESSALIFVLIVEALVVRLLVELMSTHPESLFGGS